LQLEMKELQKQMQDLDKDMPLIRISPLD
jgi:hypothetical protein